MSLFFVKITGRGIADCVYLAHNEDTSLTMVEARTFKSRLGPESEITAYKKLGYPQKFEVVEL